MTGLEEYYDKYLNDTLSHFISMFIILILDGFLLLVSLAIIKIIDIAAAVLGLENDSAILVINYFIHPLLIFILGILLVLNILGRISVERLHNPLRSLRRPRLLRLKLN